MTHPRVSRGRRSQEAVAAWFRGHGMVFARSNPASLAGVDILEMPLLACEVKAWAQITPRPWLRQASKNAKPGDVPFVVFRVNGQGEADVSEWGVLVRLDVFTELLKSAGYIPSEVE